MTKEMIATAALVCAANSALAQLSFTSDEAAFAAAADIADDFSSYATAGSSTTFSDGDLLGQFLVNHNGFATDVQVTAGVTPAENELTVFLDEIALTEFTLSSTGQAWTAFGMDVTNAFVVPGIIEIELSNGDSFSLADQVPSGVGFVGFTSDTSFDSVTVRIAGGAFFGSLSLDAVYAASVPAPGTAALAGLAGMAAIRRRR